HRLAGTNATPWRKGEVVAPAVPAGAIDGRSFDALRSRRVSAPVITWKGRPEDTSIRGATVKLLKRALAKLSPATCAEVCKTALVTQRLCWSLTEFDLSNCGKRLSCGSRVDCKSVPLSIECDQV